MAHSQNVRRFRINPVEISIFSVISIIVANSAYKLLYNHAEFSTTTLTPMSSNPISEGRNIASTSQSLATFTTNCTPQRETDGEDSDRAPAAASTSQIIQANKVRIAGPLCHLSHGNGEEVDIRRNDVSNMTTDYHATVFANATEGRFSTDYIPIIPGQNKIHLQFVYTDGNHFTQDLIISH